MSSNPFLDTVNNFLSGAGQVIGNTIHNVEQGAVTAGQAIGNFGNATMHEAQQLPQQTANFMQNNPFGRAIASQNPLINMNNPVQMPTIPQAHIQNPFINTIANMGIQIPNDFINAFNAQQKAPRLFTDTLQGKATPQQLIGNIAQQVIPATYFMGAGEAKAGATSLIENPTVRNMFMEGVHNILPTAGIMGSYTGLQGLSQNQNTTLHNQLQQAGKQTLESLPLSVPFAFAGPAVGYAAGKAMPLLQRFTQLLKGPGDIQLSPEVIDKAITGLSQRETSPNNNSATNEIIQLAQTLQKAKEGNTIEARLADIPTSKDVLPGSFTNVPELDPRISGQMLSRPDFLNSDTMPKVNKFQQAINPMSALPKDFQQATADYDRALKVARVDANQVNLQYRSVIDKLGITPQQEEALLYYSESPTAQTLKNLQERGLPIDEELVAKAKPLLDLHRQLEDERFNKANTFGIDTAYRENHTYHAYTQSPQEINDLLEGTGLSRKPGFTFKREFPTYMDARDKLGLLPKYTTLGQLSANSDEVLNRTLANKKFLNFLTSKGFIIRSTESPSGFQPVASAFFPRASDNSVYVAKPEVAHVLNNIFGGIQQGPAGKLLDTVGKLSGKAQQVILMTPGQSIHGFTLAQAGKDLATGVGEIMSGHPISGFKIAAAPIRAMIRAFVPGEAGNFERDNANSIREMAEAGIGYTGKFTYKGLQPNTAVKEGIVDSAKGFYDKAEQAIVGAPTFQKFMFQRRVSLFNAFRDAQLANGLEKPEAVAIAGEQLKKYDGIVNELGRSPEVNNFMKAFFFAPKYRESILGTLINTLKGTAQWNNQNYQYSRSLLLGMGVTYLAYNALNRTLNNGKNLWDNPAGKEFELVIPQKDASGNPVKDQYGNQRYNSIPWMSGITTVPRAVVGTIFALAKGDTNVAIQEASGLFSSPIQTIAQAMTGKGHFGNDLFDSSKPLLPQQLAYTASNLMVPGSINSALDYINKSQQGKNPSLVQAAGRVFQLPIKEGSFPNPYFAIRDSELSQLSKEDQAIVAAIPKSDPNNPAKKMDRYTILRDNPNIYNYFRNIALATSNGNPNAIDPLYAYGYQQALPYLTYESLGASTYGSPDAKALYNQNPIVSQIGQQRSAYFKANPIQGQAQSPMQAPQPSAYVQQQMDAKNWRDPQVQNFLNASTQYKNNNRAMLAMTPLSTFTSGYSSNSIKKRLTKNRIKKVKVIATKKLKLKLTHLKPFKVQTTISHAQPHAKHKAKYILANSQLPKFRAS